MMFGKTGPRLGATVTAALMAAGALTQSAPAAAASAMARLDVGCYGDYCSGKDPESTGCSADAVTVAYTPYRYGTLDLRWSNTCKTNWARINSSYTGSLQARQSTGYTQGFSSSNASYSWTKMIYSPTLCVRAQVVSSSGTTQTACI